MVSLKCPEKHRGGSRWRVVWPDSIGQNTDCALWHENAKLTWAVTKTDNLKVLTRRKIWKKDEKDRHVQPYSQAHAHTASDRGHNKPSTGSKENRKKKRHILTCRPAFALWDFWVFPADSLEPPFPPIDFPFPPGMLKEKRWEQGSQRWKCRVRWGLGGIERKVGRWRDWRDGRHARCWWMKKSEMSAPFWSLKTEWR